MLATRRGTRANSKAEAAEPPSKKMKRSSTSSTSTIASHARRGEVESLAAAKEHGDQTKRFQEKVLTQRQNKAKAKALEVDQSTFLKRIDSPWLVGAHVSAAKGVENSVVNAAAIGANAFALFLKSQRKWESPPLTESSIAEFKKRMMEYNYTSSMVLPHGSYLINLGNPDVEKREKSYTCFLDDLKRCQALGLALYNFHPGSTVGQGTMDESLTLIADCINRAHEEIQGVTSVLENMAGTGNIIGSEFSHLAGIIKRVKDKSRVGVCIDTCHAFAAGYDVRTKDGWENTMKLFDETIGLQYLRGMHLNDSKTGYKSKKDRHENIGLGYLGLPAFHHILTDPRTQHIPLILETPSFEQPPKVWGTEIEILHRVCGHGNGSASASLEGIDNPEIDFQSFVDEIKSAVKEAEIDGKGPKGKAVKGTRKGLKRKPATHKEDNEDEDEDEASDS